MGLRPLEKNYSLGVGTVFRRQNLTRQILPSKVDPRTDSERFNGRIGRSSGVLVSAMVCHAGEVHLFGSSMYVHKCDLSL